MTNRVDRIVFVIARLVLALVSQLAKRFPSQRNRSASMKTSPHCKPQIPAASIARVWHHAFDFQFRCCGVSHRLRCILTARNHR
jgi:hypothetical protein